MWLLVRVTQRLMLWRSLGTLSDLLAAQAEGRLMVQLQGYMASLMALPLARDQSTGYYSTCI